VLSLAAAVSATVSLVVESHRNRGVFAVSVVTAWLVVICLGIGIVKERRTHQP
jgi:hypothetical protein